MTNLPISSQEAAKELQRRRLARNKFTDFCRYVSPDEPPAKHHELICDAGDKVIEGAIRRLLIFMPPGSAKSTYASVKFPAYFLGKCTERSIITASYGETLATAFGRKVRNLVDGREYRTIFPEVTLTEDSRAKGEWETNQGGSYFAAGVGTGITGRRGDLGLIDDPVKGRKEADSQTVRDATWEWYKSDFLTRLKPNAAQVIIQTRWHEDDLSGRILPASWSGESGVFKGFDGQDWTVICLPAEARENDLLGRKPGEYLWTEWFDENYWRETKAAQMSSDIRNWTSLYQQMPQPETGTFFQRSSFRRYRVGDEPKQLSVYGASDYAVTDEGGDFTEHGIGGFDKNEDLWLLDWWSGQTTPDKWIDQEIALVKRHKPFVCVAEGGVIRRSVEPFLKKEQRNQNCYYRKEWITSNTDKASNARGFQALASQGKVWIPMTEWGDQLINQLVSFPAGKYDDKVDVCGLLGRLLDQTFGPRHEAPAAAHEELDAFGRKINHGSDWKTG